MSEKEKTEALRPGQVILGWWSAHLGSRETGAQRGLSARLRRGDQITVLCQPEVHRLAEALKGVGVAVSAARLVPLVRILAELRRHEPKKSLPRLLGQGDPPPVSPARFERLIRAEEEELEAALRRALPAVNHAANVAALGEALLCWDEKTRAHWCFDYYGADVPQTEDIS